MEWFPIAVGTFFALLTAVIIEVMQERWTRRKKLKQPSYEELKWQRKIFYVWYTFIGFWILMAAPRVNWSHFGTPWTGLFFMICLSAFLLAIGFIFRLIGRKKPNAQGSL